MFPVSELGREAHTPRNEIDEESRYRRMEYSSTSGRRIAAAHRGLAQAAEWENPGEDDIICGGDVSLPRHAEGDDTPTS